MPAGNLQTHDRDSLNAFKQAQESVAEGESSKDLSRILAAKKSEAKPDSNRTRKLLSSMISVKGRERYTVQHSNLTPSERVQHY